MYRSYVWLQLPRSRAPSCGAVKHRNGCTRHARPAADDRATREFAVASARKIVPPTVERRMKCATGLFAYAVRCAPRRSLSDARLVDIPACNFRQACQGQGRRSSPAAPRAAPMPPSRSSSRWRARFAPSAGSAVTSTSRCAGRVRRLARRGWSLRRPVERQCGASHRGGSGPGVGEIAPRRYRRSTISSATLATTSGG